MKTTANILAVGVYKGGASAKEQTVATQQDQYNYNNIMPLYEIKIPELHYSTRVVEAKTEEEALELASNSRCLGLDYIQESDYDDRKSREIILAPHDHSRASYARINFSWSTDDVYSRNEKLSFRMCLEILEIMDRKLDAEVGICWDVIDMYIDDYLNINQAKRVVEKLKQLPTSGGLCQEPFEDFPTDTPLDLIYEWLEELFEVDVDRIDGTVTAY